eukprot:11170690-Lingulodinium_polyedra.AAC.1
MAAPPMPMLRFSPLRGPKPVSTRATTVRPQMRAQATRIARSGSCHPRRTSRIQACQMRSNAFS